MEFANNVMGPKQNTIKMEMVIASCVMHRVLDAQELVQQNVLAVRILKHRRRTALSVQLAILKNLVLVIYVILNAKLVMKLAQVDVLLAIQAIIMTPVLTSANNVILYAKNAQVQEHQTAKNA